MLYNIWWIYESGEFVPTDDTPIEELRAKLMKMLQPLSKTTMDAATKELSTN